MRPQGSDRVALFARRLKSLDNSTVYPLLLYILTLPAEKLSAAARDQVLEDLESWLVRRFVCQMTNKNYNKFFVSLLGLTRLQHGQRTSSSSRAGYPYGSAPLEEGEDQERGRERLLHTLGNLTLLTTELNSAVSNGPFPQKAAAIAIDSDLRLNAWLRSDDRNGWKEDDIIARGELLFETASEVWWRPDLEPDNVDEVEGGDTKFRFTSQERLKTNRERILAAFADRENVAFHPVSTSKFSTSDGDTRAVVTLSKRYDRPGYRYWYAYHPEWDEFLSRNSIGWLILGCVDGEECYVIPREVIYRNLEHLNITQKVTGNHYWHLHITDSARGAALLLPKRNTQLPLNEFTLKLTVSEAATITAQDELSLQE